MRAVARVRSLMTALADPSIEGRTRRAAAFSVLARVFNAGVLLLTHVLLARVLGIAEFGLFSIAMTWVLTMVGFATLGMALAPQRFGPVYAAQGQRAEAAGLYRFCHAAPFAAGLLLALAGATLPGVLMPSLSPDTRLAIGLALLALPALALLDVTEGYALAHEWGDLAYGVTFVLRPLLLPVLLAALWLGGAGMGIMPALIAFVAAAWIAALVMVVALNRRMTDVAATTPRAYPARDWFALALPALLADGAFLTMTYADTLVLAAFAPPAEVGIYAAALKLVGVIAFVQYGLAYAAAHHFAALHASGEHVRLLAYARRAARWTFWPSLAFAGVVCLTSPLLLGLFGPGFAAGNWLVPVLALPLMARAFFGPLEQLLLMTGRQRAVTVIFASAAALNIALALALAPNHGAFGVAIGCAIASMAATFAIALLAARALSGAVHAFARLPAEVSDQAVSKP